MIGAWSGVGADIFKNGVSRSGANLDSLELELSWSEEWSERPISDQNTKSNQELFV